MNVYTYHGLCFGLSTMDKYVCFNTQFCNLSCFGAFSSYTIGYVLDLGSTTHNRTLCHSIPKDDNKAITTAANAIPSTSIRAYLHNSFHSTERLSIVDPLSCSLIVAAENDANTILAQSTAPYRMEGDPTSFPNQLNSQSALLLARSQSLSYDPQAIAARAVGQLRAGGYGPALVPNSGPGVGLPTGVNSTPQTLSRSLTAPGPPYAGLHPAHQILSMPGKPCVTSSSAMSGLNGSAQLQPAAMAAISGIQYNPNQYTASGGLLGGKMAPTMGVGGMIPISSEATIANVRSSLGQEGMLTQQQQQQQQLQQQQMVNMNKSQSNRSGVYLPTNYPQQQTTGYPNTFMQSTPQLQQQQQQQLQQQQLQQQQLQQRSLQQQQQQQQYQIPVGSQATIQQQQQQQQYYQQQQLHQQKLQQQQQMMMQIQNSSQFIQGGQQGVGWMGNIPLSKW